MHSSLKNYVKHLNSFYKKTPALWEIDFSWDGFKWISDSDRDQNTIAFIRKDKNGESIISLINFAPVNRDEYRIGVSEPGIYKEVFNSDLTEYGGWGNKNKKEIKTEEIPMHGYSYSVSVKSPPLAMICLKLKGLIE